MLFVCINYIVIVNVLDVLSMSWSLVLIFHDCAFAVDLKECMQIYHQT